MMRLPGNPWPRRPAPHVRMCLRFTGWITRGKDFAELVFRRYQALRQFTPRPPVMRKQGRA